MIKCGISISGIDDKIIKDNLSKTLLIFEKQGHHLKNEVQFLGNGIIAIEGVGKDHRCAFCEYFRKAVATHLENGEVRLMKCPFYPDKMIDKTPETVAARKRLIEMFVKSQGERVVEKMDH